MSRDTATEAEANGLEQHEQSLFDLSELRLGPPRGAESSAVSAISSAQPHIHEGYGFRPSSGIGTPQIDATPERSVKSPIPDAYGLGWPGVSLSSLFPSVSDHHLGNPQSVQPNQLYRVSILPPRNEPRERRNLRARFELFSSASAKTPIAMGWFAPPPDMLRLSCG